MSSTFLLRRILTGHMHAGSLYETCHSCDNCDGARCDTCKEFWEVEDYPNDKFKRFKTKKEALDYMNKEREDANGIHEA